MRWQVEAEVSFQGDFAEPVQLRMQLPHRTPGYMLIDDSFLSRGYGQFIENDEMGNRLVVWTIREGKPNARLYYRVTVVPYANEDGLMSQPPRQPLPESVTLSPVEEEALRVLDVGARERSIDTISYVQGLLQMSGSRSGRDALRILGADEGGNGAVAERMRVFSLLLTRAGIHSRFTHGISLSVNASNVPMDFGLEFWDEQAKRWRYLHGPHGEIGRPVDLLIWYRGDLPRATLTGARTLRVNYSVSPQPLNVLELGALYARSNEWPLAGFSLFRLPMKQQQLFQVLLLIPFGALILAFFRNVIGWKCFGTFMPVLITLSFRETGIWWGTGLFLAVIFAGFLVRVYLEHLKLLFVPRLTALLSVVIVILLGINLISYQAGFDVGLAISFFPMVILTMTIERISVVWEESGTKEAVQQVLGSFTLSLLLYPILFSSWVQHWFLVFPELILVVLACSMLLGRYTGYRLTERWRFAPLLKRMSVSQNRTE